MSVQGTFSEAQTAPTSIDQALWQEQWLSICGHREYAKNTEIGTG
jgi:hypothetical protein